MPFPKNAPLIVFGEDWGAHPSSTQHLVKCIAKERPVIWVNSIGMRRPKLSLKDLRRVGAKLKAMVSRAPLRNTNGSETPASITVINPRAVSWPGNPLANTVNRATVAAQVNTALRKLGVREAPMLWISLPTAACMVGAFNEQAVLYYAGDDFSALEGVDHEPVSRMEAELARSADAIVAASDRIAAKFPRQKTFIISHGCDIDLFSTPARTPKDLRPNPNDQRPIAGFYGSLSTWLDQDLLASTAERLPDWRFVMIGEERCDLSKLKALPNMEFLGPRPHSQLPGYAQSWDVSLMPFKDTAQIRACNPLKLREYLAAGTPIVTTEFPALNPYRQHVSIEKHPDRYALLIKRALREGSTWRANRQKAVSGESWQSKANDIAVLLNVLQNEAPSQNGSNLITVNQF